MRSRLRKKTHHTANKPTEGVKKVTITHPFHASAKKEYDYLCMTKFYGIDYVTCIDEHGKRCMFPVNITDLRDAYDVPPGSDCVMTIDDLLSLKELVDGLARSPECK